MKPDGRHLKALLSKVQSGKKKSNDPFEGLSREALAKYAMQCNQIREMAAHPGWQLVCEWMERSCNESNLIAASKQGDISRTINRIEAYHDLKNMVEATIRQGERAEKILHDRESAKEN